MEYFFRGQNLENVTRVSLIIMAYMKIRNHHKNEW
jgi:hypothetical protein